MGVSLFRVRTKDGTTAIFFPMHYTDELREFLVAHGLTIQPTRPEPYTLTDENRAFVLCARIDAAAPVEHEFVEALVARFGNQLVTNRPQCH
jgi:hypothetical protein